MKTEKTSIATSPTGVSISKEMIRSREHSAKTALQKPSNSISDCLETTDREPDAQEAIELVQEDREPPASPGGQLDLSG